MEIRELELFKIGLINGRPRRREDPCLKKAQENPLSSSMLFLLVVDILSRIVSKCVKGNIIKGFEDIFADDAIFLLGEDEFFSRP